jgi:hypothetical protein
MRNKIGSILPALVVFVLLSTAASAAVEWKITPSNPTVGDTFKIEGKALQGENINADVSFEKNIAVSGGKYRYLLEKIKIPEGNNNRFTVRASGVQNMNIGVKETIWITKSAKAGGGVVTISQSNIVPSTYSLLISGGALKEKSSVNVRITASQTLKTDTQGNFKYNYDTSTMPAGKYTIKIGNSEKTIELKAKK